MGLRGTDVAKGAADMILTDDNFASIIGAVEEGRRQYDNIRKFVRYMMASNTSEVLAILLNILLQAPLILLPVQILWINLVTDGVNSLALAVEPAEEGVMRRPPHSPRSPILGHQEIATILLIGGYIAFATLWLFHHYLEYGGEQALPLAQTTAFTGMIVMELVNVLNFRRLWAPVLDKGFFTNRWLLWALLANLGMQLGAVYLPFLQDALHTVPLGWQQWSLIIVLALPILFIMEGYKRLRWRHTAGQYD